VPAKPDITKVTWQKVPPRHENIHPFLVNVGDAVLQKGTIFAEQYFKDGTVQYLHIYNGNPLNPGEVTKLMEQAAGVKQFKLQKYICRDGSEHEMSRTLVRGLFGRWSVR
jgi:hypothetical protein